jgi:hypothetical protein
VSEELQGSEVLVHLAAHIGNVPYDSIGNILRWNLSQYCTYLSRGLDGIH